VLPQLIAAGAPIYGLPIDGQVIDIGTLEVYERYRRHGLRARPEA
jgi:NDP-sugar pyrophosphorylase family protein